MKYKIKEEHSVYKGFLTIKKATLVHDRFQEDTEPITCTREMLDKGDCVGVLLYEKDTDCLIMVNQFRYPTVEHTNGWLLEIVAGGIENNEDPEKSAIREIEEETGYRVNELEFITSFYTTPGNSSERMFLYYSEVIKSDKLYDGGGVKGELEDIQVYKFKCSEIDKLLTTNAIVDAKSIIALQWFKMYKNKD